MVLVPTALDKLMLLVDYQLELTRPAFMCVLLVWACIGWGFFRSLVDASWKQRILSAVVRATVIGLLALALAGLQLLRATHEQCIVVAIDQSASVDTQSAGQMDARLTAIRSAAANNKLVYLTFANQPDNVSDDFPSADSTRSTADGTPDKSRLGTNLAAAIEAATAALSPFYVPHIFLLSDGNQTAGDSLRAALSAGVPIHTVPLPTRSDPEVQVSEIVVPAEVRQSEPFYVEVVIDTNHDDQGTIQVFAGDVQVNESAGSVHEIRKGGNRFRFRQEIADQRLLNYSARISGFNDTLLDNNMASGTVSASGSPRVLLVNADAGGTDYLRGALEEQGIRVDVRPPVGIPDRLAELQTYEVVLISNVPATALTTRQMEVLRTYVQDLGGGLVMIGGDQSFGLGGYYKTTLEEVLPVRSDFEKEKEKPSLAMVFAIDRSGSMADQKLELAKAATKSAIELLGPNDQVGVIAFDSSAYWVSELHGAADASRLMDSIAAIQSGGGTNLYPAMEAAFESLSNAVAKLKHLIVLTDGQSTPADFDGLTASMSSQRITVSTVGVGQGTDVDLLRRIADQGNGRYYYCEDPASIPQVFAKETITASKSVINEQPFVPQLIRPTQVLSSIDFEAAPFLLGFVATRPKPTSEFILATETGEPLLVWWRYGLGMTAAFTSDAGNRWATEWAAWPDFSTFWAQIVRHCMRTSGDAAGVDVEMYRHGRFTEIRLDTVDAAGRFRNNAETVVTVFGPSEDMEKTNVVMQQSAPGRYVATIDTLQPGAYHFDLSQKFGSEVIFHQTRGMVVGYPDELRLRPTNEPLLRAIAETSGGQFTTKPGDVLKNDKRTVYRSEPLWPFLIPVAMCLFLADVALRRIDFPLLK